MSCSHGTRIGTYCMHCEKEAMQDFILHNLESFTVNEIAEAVREGVITLRQVATQVRVDQVWTE